MKKTKKTNPIAVYAISIAVCIALFLASFYNHGQATNLLKSGKEISATVTDKYHDHDRYYNDSYNVSYTYVVNGKKYNGSSDASEPLYDLLDVGGPTTVTYLPSNPSVSSFQPDDDQDSGMAMMVITGSIGVILAFMLTWARFKVAKLKAQA